eukprot:1597162-Rhodomonas_salina.2
MTVVYRVSGNRGWHHYQSCRCWSDLEPIVVFSRFKKWRENSPFLGVLVKAWARWASAAIANAPWMLTLTILNIVKVEERQRSCLAGEGARAQGCSVVDVLRLKAVEEKKKVAL